MPIPKRHHYLPEFYLYRFTEAGFLWVFDRIQGKLRREQPKNIVVRSHYYSLIDESGNRSTKFEELLAKIEGRARPAFDSLESGNRLTEQERYDLANFMGFLLCRTPAFARSMNEGATAFVETILRKNFNDPETAKSFDVPAEAMLEYLDSGNLLVKAKDNTRIRFVAEMGETFAKYFLLARWTLAKADAKWAFVTSDNPFGHIFPRLTPKRVRDWALGSSFPGVKKVFPVSRKACLLIENDMRDWDIRHIDLDRDAVREINLAVVSETETYAIAKDERHLRSLALDGGLFEPEPNTKIVMEDYPDPSGDPRKSTFITRRSKIR